MAQKSQRDYMKILCKDFNFNREKVITAYAHAEDRGLVRRKSNSSEIDSVSYARALWADGERKGWLFDKGTSE